MRGVTPAGCPLVAAESMAAAVTGAFRNGSENTGRFVYAPVTEGAIARPLRTNLEAADVQAPSDAHCIG
jgi:hypothetical protein